MAEFDEVGRTIEGFAAEDATVVLGTVLDPDMQDEVRVTVVATGLNRTAAARAPIGRDGRDGINLREPMRAPIKLVRDGTTGMAYDANAGMDPVAGAVGGLGLRRGSAEPATSSAAAPAVADLPDYLDIPAFLRRQAD
jgi:cell division protein FtsZ